jgi:hypothetical protein
MRFNKLIDFEAGHVAGIGSTAKLTFEAGAGVKDIQLTRAQAAKTVAVLAEFIASDLSE